MKKQGSSDSFEAIVAYAFDGFRLEHAERLTGGVSADVYRLDLRDPAGRVSAVVVRIHGNTHSGHPAALEFELLRSLWASGVPVAEPLALDITGNIIPEAYLIMDFIHGSTTATGSRLEYFTAMADALAALHGAETESLPRLPVRVDPVPELLEFLADDPEWDVFRSYLLTIRNAPYTGSPCLLHGDFWPQNLLWHGGELAAILDWEDAALGDPLSDVACCRLELRYLYGVEGMESFTSAYERHVTLDGQRLALWQIYVAAAAHAYMARWGLPPQKEAHMHRVALATMRESAALVLESSGGNCG